MRPMKVLAVALFLSSTGLGATEAQACFFSRCRSHHRQVVCAPPGYTYGGYPTADGRLPQSEPPVASSLAGTVNFLLGVVTQQQYVTLTDAAGVSRTYKV
jgi:hypothetical protein